MKTANCGCRPGPNFPGRRYAIYICLLGLRRNEVSVALRLAARENESAFV